MPVAQVPSREHSEHKEGGAVFSFDSGPFGPWGLNARFRLVASDLTLWGGGGAFPFSKPPAFGSFEPSFSR